MAGRCRRGEEPLPITEHEQDTVAAHLAKGEHRPAGTIWRPNPREQGLIGLTDAIAWFGAQGWDIALPLIDSQPYDLVVDDRERLYRVQVKTTRPGRLEVGSSSRSAPNGGNQSFHMKKPFDPSASDLLYVLTDAGERYLIPTMAVTTRTSLTLGPQMQQYRIDAP